MKCFPKWNLGVDTYFLKWKIQSDKRDQYILLTNGKM